MSPAALRAIADAADALARLARAALETDVSPAGATWVPLETAAEELGVKVRVLTDDERRGRIVLGGAGRSRVVDRAELDRYVASRRQRRRAGAETEDDLSPRDAARAAVAARSKRAA